MSVARGMGGAAKPGKSDSSPATGPSGSHDDWITEWKSCRTDLARFDGYLDALRKQGFSFVTALLSATTLVGFVAGSVVTPEVKAAILIVTEGLIVALAFLEKEYRLMGEATAIRARILERQLNLAESDTIAIFFEAAMLWLTDLILNLGFVVLTLAFGCALLAPPNGLSVAGLVESWPLNAVSLATLVAALLVLWSSHRHLDKNLDLEVDRICVKQGDPVRFTIYSLYPTSRMPFRNRRPGGWNGRKRSPYRLVLKLAGTQAPRLRLNEVQGGTDSPAAPPILHNYSVQLNYLEGYEIEWDTTNHPVGLYRWTLDWESPEWDDPKSPWRRPPGWRKRSIGSAEHSPLEVAIEVV